MLSNSLSRAVLTVGEKHINNRGGIGTVINSYSKHFSTFKFLETYKNQRAKWLIIPYFISASLKLLLLLLTDRDIKVLHIHGASKGSMYRKMFVLLIAKFIFHKTTIYHCHGSEFKDAYEQYGTLYKRITRFLINNADLVICLSQQWLNFIKDNFGPKKIVILQNIVDKPSPPSEDLIITENQCVNLLFVGRIGDRKGIFDLIEVLAEHKEFFKSKILLTIAGDGEVNRLKKLLELCNLKDIVNYVGWLTGDKKDYHFRNCDLYILPSYNEGLPISILEAMSYSKPVISTPVGGIPEIVKDGKNGYLVPPGNKQELFNKINIFLENPKKLTEMGLESQQLVTMYYAQNVIPKLCQIYEELVY